jgi:hypothetical protein
MQSCDLAVVGARAKKAPWFFWKTAERAYRVL